MMAHFRNHPNVVGLVDFLVIPHKCALVAITERLHYGACPTARSCGGQEGGVLGNYLLGLACSAVFRPVCIPFAGMGEAVSPTSSSFLPQYRSPPLLQANTHTVFESLATLFLCGRIRLVALPSTVGELRRFWTCSPKAASLLTTSAVFECLTFLDGRCID